MSEAIRSGLEPVPGAMPDMSGWKKLKTEETPWPATLRCLSVGGAYEAVGADLEKLKDAKKIDIADGGGLSSILSPLRAGFRRDVMVFGHNLLWLGFFAKSIRMYNPVGGAYYHAENSDIDLAGNLLYAAGLVLYHTLFFFTHARRQKELSLERFGLGGLELPAQSTSTP
ncbi:MAG: hypothetical protein M1530_02790 [Candidatus Marsarchaeota archaeon]|nr:hypothetical protein [Candidatus Marsarchaeota archaeon]